MRTTALVNARVIDPANGIDNERRDLYIRDGRIVTPPARDEQVETIVLAGRITMAGGIDLHTHIGGGKVNLSRLLLPEDHRDNAPATNPLELPSAGGCVPGTLHTGYRYAEMGYTAAFEPAMVFANARHAHMEMGDVPIVDHGAYVMLGNDELLLEMLSRGEDFERIRDYVGFVVDASKSMGVKVVNPGGISAFKFNQRKLDVDEAHARWGVTPRQIVATLARAVHELGIVHPLHIHGSNLGVPGNIASTLATIDALDGAPGHLTHVQFHCYGDEGPKKMSSAAVELIDALKQHPHVSIDVGQIIFGQTVTASGDTMRQHANSGLGSPRKWVGADIECDAGCGVVPFKYREQSYVNALQWAIGLELFLLHPDPWRIVLTTDHPNGGPFTSYPHLIRLLMDKPFRDEQLARLHPDVASQSALREIARELTLYEVAILTRAGPAKLLGLTDRGHLGVGAAADIAVYRADAPDPQAMFATPELVFKDGVVVARDGRIVACPTGGVHFVVPRYDASVAKRFAEYRDRSGSVNPRYGVISRDELCACGNGGRLFPRVVQA